MLISNDIDKVLWFLIKNCVLIIFICNGIIFFWKVFIFNVIVIIIIVKVRMIKIKVIFFKVYEEFFYFLVNIIKLK